MFGVAPLFHITGVVGHLAIALLLPEPLVLAYRFEPAVVLDAIREHRPTFSIGSITVFIAMMNADGAQKDDLVVAGEDLLRGRADPADDDQGLPGPVRALHPQLLRAHRDQLAVARRAARGRRPGGRGVRRAVGGRAGVLDRGLDRA